MLTNKKSVAIFISDVAGALETGSEALSLLHNSVNKAIVAEAVNEGKISDFETAVKDFEYDKATADTITANGKTKILELLKGGNYRSEAEYVSALRKQIALQAVNYNVNQSSDNIHAVLIEQSSILGINLDGFYKLSIAKQINAAHKFAAQKNGKLNGLQPALDKIVNDLIGNDSGGGGSNTTANVIRNNSLGTTEATSISSEYILEQKYIYSDLREASWAADAVVFLNKKGIVSGYEDGSFKPLNLITRAEFTKMVVQAFLSHGLSSDESIFHDVPVNEWYAPYINIAYREGFVQGSGNGAFRPNDPITRQDMAFIIYNSAKKYDLIDDSKADNLKFIDDSEISDYAKNAVYSMRKKRIISGVGENMFQPLAFADRASAAQIIYSLMINLTE